MSLSYYISLTCAIIVDKTILSGEPWNPQVSNLTQVINSILFLIFDDQPYFNEPGYQQSRNTIAGDTASNHYNEIIMVSTLQYAYLEHFKKINEMSKYILPLLVYNWKSFSRNVALKWKLSNHKKNSVITKYIDEIDTVVKEYTSK